MKKILTNYFKASFPCIAIKTTEEQRAMADVINAAKSLSKGILTWSATEGLKQIAPEIKEYDDTQDLYAAVKMPIIEERIYILRDIQTWPFDRDPILARAIRDYISGAPEKGTC